MSRPDLQPVNASRREMSHSSCKRPAERLDLRSFLVTIDRGLEGRAENIE